MRKVLIVIIVIVAIVAIILGIGWGLNKGRQDAESAARQENPTFHTLPEGSACRPDMGDCQAGLTCADSVCRRPE